jgi:hypothetical protein
VGDHRVAGADTSEEELAEPVDVPQRRAQIVRDGVGERLEVVVQVLQLLRSVDDALLEDRCRLPAAADRREAPALDDAEAAGPRAGETSECRELGPPPPHVVLGS